MHTLVMCQTCAANMYRADLNSHANVCQNWRSTIHSKCSQLHVPRLAHDMEQMHSKLQTEWIQRNLEYRELPARTSLYPK